MRAWLAGYDCLVDPDRLEAVAAERAVYDWRAAIVDPLASFALGYVDGSPAGVAKIGSLVVSVGHAALVSTARPGSGGQ